MSDQFESGFAVRVASWHGKETLLDEHPDNWNDAKRLAGLDWEPIEEPVYKRDVTIDEDGHVHEHYVTLKDNKVITRSDNANTLGVVGEGFTPVLNETLGEIVEEILGLDNVKFETAGSVRGGRQVYALAKLDEPEYIAGDDTPTYPYLTALNAHDGTSAFKVLPTSVRVVCANTYQAASLEGDKHGKQFIFRHTGKVMDRIEEAKAAIAGTRQEQAAWIALADDLYALPASDDAFANFLTEFIPDPVEHGAPVSDRVKANVAEARSKFRKLYTGSVTTEGHRGTALGLVDASVEYLDHFRGYRNHDTYLGRTLLRPEPLKAKAVKLAREVCSV